MLFNSYTFIFIFLPVVLTGFHLIGKHLSHKITISWLVAASLFFYAWWNPAYLGLILTSILFNYTAGVLLSTRKNKYLLVVAISINLCLLAYFKYANFFISNINALTQSQMTLEEVLLPIAISFFTFQQITYLVDMHNGSTKAYDLLHYSLFVTFFPQLIAGPIVHHKEMLPQFIKNTLSGLKLEHVVIGITIFSIGLFKKCILADGIAIYATPVFDAAEQGEVITFFEAWGGALAYSFQLYFDFSGYSEMAMGLARLFGIQLPANFFSPYKANSIIDFWRRWHITLSRFLRQYLYIPLGGNQKGAARRYINLMLTMVLGGLWHGAGWTFLLWGTLHGFYLMINHLWRKITARIFYKKTNHNTWLTKLISRSLTFTAIVFAWVVFRAESLQGALGLYKGMLGINGYSFPVQLANTANTLQTIFSNTSITAQGLGSFGSPLGLIMLFLLLLLVWIPPNTLEIMSLQKPLLNIDQHDTKSLNLHGMAWKPKSRWAITTAFFAVLSVMSLTQVSEFLYFQF